MTVPSTPRGPESSPRFTPPETLTDEGYAEAIARSQAAQIRAASAEDYRALADAQRAESILQAGRLTAARDRLKQEMLKAESPAKKGLRAKLIENQAPKARETIAFNAVHTHTKAVARALRERGFSPDRESLKYARTYIAQTPRLVPSKAAPSILEIGWRDAGTPSDDSKPSMADRFRNWVERSSSKPEPATKTVWLTDAKGQLGSSNPMSRTHDMVRGCGFDANGDIYIVDSANIADRSKASEGSGNRLRSVVDPYTYIVDHGFDASVITIPSAFSMMRSHVEGVGVPGKDAEGLGYLAFYDHFVASANALYKGVTGEDFSPAEPTTEPTVAEAAVTITPPASPMDHA